jgi:hypothetical protein
VQILDILYSIYPVNRAACGTGNNKLHNEKTPQLTKGQRYDRLKRKSTFQTSWKEKIPWPWVEASGRLITTVIYLPHIFTSYFSLA